MSHKALIYFLLFVSQSNFFVSDFQTKGLNVQIRLVLNSMPFSCVSEFHKDGKYDLDFKNPNSDPAKWVSIQPQRKSKSTEQYINNYYCYFKSVVMLLNLTQTFALCSAVKK